MRSKITLWFRSLLVISLAGVLLPSHAQTEIRAEWFNGTCPKGLPADIQQAPQKFASVLAAVGAVIIPKLVSGGVDLAAKKLQAAGEDRPNTLSARTDAYFYNYLRERRNTLNARCLIVVEADNFNATPAAEEPHTWRPLTARVGAYENARMIFMASVDPAPEGKLFRLVPAYLELKDWRERSFWGSSQRDYNIAVTLAVIGASEHFASVNMAFKGLVNNKTYTLTDSLMGGAATDYVPFAPLSAEGTKHINAVESAWSNKDRAASILDAKLRFDNEPADRAAGKIPPPVPVLYRDPYLVHLTDYCGSVRTANRDLEKSKREVPAICSWELDLKLAAVNEARKEIERSADWLQWAQQICWPEPQERARQTAMAQPDGHECTEPANLKNQSTPHTRVSSLVAVTEVISGSKTAKFLGDALSASSADVSKVIVDRLPPFTKEARDAADAADRVLLQAVIDADFKVELAENELAELPDDAPASKVTAARMKRQAAWYVANNAYRSVGRTPPYPEENP